MADLIDSSVIIDLERRGLAASELLPYFPGRMHVAAITASELLVGVHMAGSVERKQRRGAFVEQVLSSVQVLPFDLTVARRHARLRSELRSGGIVVGAHDVQIAATALVHDLDLVTLNIREFDSVPGLVVKPFSA